MNDTPRMDKAACGLSFGPIITKIIDEGRQLERELAASQQELKYNLARYDDLERRLAKAQKYIGEMEDKEVCCL